MSEELEIIVEEEPCSDDICHRVHRPSGIHYSMDKSKRMKEMHADGRAGGGEFGKLGGRPRKPRVGQAIADYAREKQEKIIKVFDEALSDEMPMKVRLSAAEQLDAISRKEAAQELEEDKFDELSRDVLEGSLLELLGDPDIQRALDVEVVDAEVVK